METREEFGLLNFRFDPPDRGKMWAGLALTIRQAADLTGVSERQIQHWLNQGYVPASPHDIRRLSGDALDLIALIRQARRAGIPLRLSVTLARAELARQAAGPLADANLLPDTIADLEEKLVAAGGAIELVRLVLTELRESAPKPSVIPKSPVTRVR